MIWVGTTRGIKTSTHAASIPGPGRGPKRRRCNPTKERLENISEEDRAEPETPHFFTFPEDAHWNAERQAVEFGVEIGEYHGVVRVPRRVFQRLLPERPTPSGCVEAYYLQRTRFEGIAERKLRRQQLTEDGNVEISGRDLREAPDADRRNKLG
jgi:hypothetical protein